MVILTAVNAEEKSGFIQPRRLGPREEGKKEGGCVTALLFVAFLGRRGGFWRVRMNFLLFGIEMMLAGRTCAWGTGCMEAEGVQLKCW